MTGKNSLDMSIRKSISVEKRRSRMEREEAECKKVNMRQSVIYPFKEVCCDKKVRDKLSIWGRDRVLFVLFLLVSQYRNSLRERRQNK